MTSSVESIDCTGFSQDCDYAQWDTDNSVFYIQNFALESFPVIIAFLNMVASNLYINLFIELCPLLVGMYCSDCLQQKRSNQNLFWRVYHEGGDPLIPTCVTSNHYLIYSFNLD